MRLSGLVLGLVTSLWAGGVGAQGLPPLPRGRVVLDLVQGPVLGDNRALGLGGAQTAMVEGAVGIGANVAAPAVRAPCMMTGELDWGVNFDWLLPRFGDDLDGNGIRLDEGTDAFYLLGGAALQAGRWGVGLDANVAYAARQTPGAPSLETLAVTGRLAIAHRFGTSGLHAGAALRYALFQIAERGDPVFRAFGTGVEAGVLYRMPGNSTWIGANVSSAARGQLVSVLCGECPGWVMPDNVESPWRASLGAAVWLASRHDHQTWVNGRWVVLATDFIVTGTVTNGAGVEAFLAGAIQETRDQPMISPRAGLETQVWPARLRIRLGTYWEPARYEDVPGRAHITFGVDVRLFGFRLLGGVREVRVGAVGDLTRGYGNLGVGLGFWK